VTSPGQQLWFELPFSASICWSGGRKGEQPVKHAQIIPKYFLLIDLVQLKQVATVLAATGHIAAAPCDVKHINC